MIDPVPTAAHRRKRSLTSGASCVWSLYPGSQKVNPSTIGNPFSGTNYLELVSGDFLGSTTGNPFSGTDFTWS